MSINIYIVCTVYTCLLLFCCLPFFSLLQHLEDPYQKQFLVIIIMCLHLYLVTAHCPEPQVFVHTSMRCPYRCWPSPWWGLRTAGMWVKRKRGSVVGLYNLGNNFVLLFFSFLFLLCMFLTLQSFCQVLDTTCSSISITLIYLWSLK